MKRFTLRELQSLWSALGTYLLVVAVAWKSGGFAELWEALTLFFNGQPEALPLEGATLIHSIPLCAATLVIDIPISIAIGLIVHNVPKVHWGRLTRALGARGPEIGFLNSLARTVKKVEDSGRNVFTYFFGIVTLEELFARWLFLGVLYWPVMFIPVVWVRIVLFYLLFVLGNGLWALAHLGNYERAYGRSLLWVLPQFVGGIGLTIIYWRYGFWAALLAHFAYDCLLWVLEKEQTFDAGDAIHIGISALYGIVFYFLLDSSPVELIGWVGGDAVEAVDGWGSWELAKLALCYQGFAGVLFGLLCYDQSGSEKQASTASAIKVGCLPLLFCYAGFWALQGVAGSVPIAILIYALWRTFSARDTSSSAMCRTFWCSVPFAALIICSVQVLSFAGGLWFLFLTAALVLPLNFFEHVAREDVLRSNPV